MVLKPEPYLAHTNIHTYFATVSPAYITTPSIHTQTAMQNSWQLGFFVGRAEGQVKDNSCKENNKWLIEGKKQHGK